MDDDTPGRGSSDRNGAPVPESERWEMLRQHRDDAVAALRRLGFDAGEAEDWVHDAMIRLVRRADLDPRGVRSLLIRAASHVGIDRLRRHRRGDRITERLAASAMADIATPEQVAQSKADAARVLDMIMLLPRRERQVMVLRIMGFSVGDTAHELGVSYKSVEGTYARARQRLRNMLRDTIAAIASVGRRLSFPGNEAVAGVAALVFAMHGLVGRVPATVPEGGALAWAGSAADGDTHGDIRPLQPDRIGLRAAPSQLAAAVAPAPSGPPPGSRGHDGRISVTTGPVSGPPTDGPGSPPLVYFGGITINHDPTPIDPVGIVEWCFLEGGWVVDPYNGGCSYPPPDKGQ